MKTMLIVGASGGVGTAIARQAQSEFKVHALSRNPVTAGPEVVAHVVDILNDELPVLDGPLTALVYCPGTMNLKPFIQLKTEDVLQDLQVNVIGAVRCLQHYAKNLQASGEGSVVLFSTVAVQTGFPFHASVAAAKGAVEGLTRALAAEWAPKVRVNAIAPSLTETALTARLLADDNKKQQAAQRHPLKRTGHVQDMAEMAVFLLTPRSGWITGQVMHVDGGVSSVRI